MIMVTNSPLRVFSTTTIRNMSYQRLRSQGSSPHKSIRLLNEEYQVSV